MKISTKLRNSIERLEYLSDVYEGLNVRMNTHNEDNTEDLKLQMEITKKEMLQLLYLVEKNVKPLLN